MNSKSLQKLSSVEKSNSGKILTKASRKESKQKIESKTKKLRKSKTLRKDSKKSGKKLGNSRGMRERLSRDDDLRKSNSISDSSIITSML